jgi:hypothetical protein
MNNNRPQNTPFDQVSLGLRRFSSNPLICTLICTLICIILLMLLCGDLLFSGKMAPIHDTFKGYPFFHFFVQNIQNNTYPLWSHYTHFGEPFWPYAQFFGFIDPIYTLVTAIAWLGNFSNYTLMYSWVIFLHILVFFIGCIVVIPRLVNFRNEACLRIVIAPIIIFGTISIASWQQAFGTILVIAYFPLFAFVLDRLVVNFEGDRWQSRLFFGVAAAGLGAFSINSGNPLYFLFNCIFFLIPVILVRRAQRVGLRKSFWRPMPIIAGLTFPLMAALSLPAILLFLRKKNFFPIGRAEWDYGSANDWEVVADSLPAFSTASARRGTPGEWGDLFQSINFQGLFSNVPVSEISLYWGVFGFIALILGVTRIFSREYALIFVFLLSLLISMGDAVGLTTIISQVLPFFGLIRHFEYWQSYSFFWGLIVISIGFTVAFDLLGHFSPRTRLLPVALYCFLLITAINASLFPAELRNRTQSTPLVMQKLFPFKGDKFNSYRTYTLSPLSPVGNFLDQSKSQGEPFLFYQETSRFFDNASQFLIPIRYWNYIKAVPYDQLPKHLGLSEPTLQTVIGETHPISIDSYSANHLSFTVLSNTAKSTIVFKENFMPGWAGYRNTEQITLSPSDDTPFIYLNLEQGVNNITLKYQPPFLILGLYFLYFFQFLSFAILLYFFLNSILFSSVSQHLWSPDNND